MKKAFKKVVSILLVAVMVFGSAPLAGFVGLELPVLNLFSTKAEAATYSGTCAENLTWNLDTSTGELTINGTGAMRDWSGYYSHAPWYNYSLYIEKVIIGDNVTCIGIDAFEDCEYLTCVIIPSSIKSVGDYAFNSCDNLKEVYFEGTNTEWESISIGANNNPLLNATIHTKSIIVTVDSYTTVDGSVAQFKEYGITISSSDENAPLPKETYLKTNNLGRVSFPIEIAEDDLQGLSGKTFVYDLTITSADGKKYDFVPETQKVEITITNENGVLTQTTEETLYRFDGYSYYDYTVTLTWDDCDNVCKVRPDKLDLTLVSHLGELSVPFILNKDNSWKTVLSVRNTDNDAYFHRYSVEGFDSDIGYEYDVRTYESYNKNGANITAVLPVCSVDFITPYGIAPETQYLIKNSYATEPVQPTDSCYIFIGWYKDEACTDGKEWNFDTDKVSGSTKLYAKWDVKLIDITLKTEYGALQSGGNKKELVTTIPAGSVVGIKLSEELYDSYYTHIGWVDGEGQSVTSYTKFYEDTTLYAVWEKKQYFDSTVSIKNNFGSQTINYGETLELSVSATDKPDNADFYWYIDGEWIDVGEKCNIKFEKGTKTVTVKLIGEDGSVLKDKHGNEISDTEFVTVKAGFFQKIISFFKNLFGMNRTIVQAVFRGVF